MSAAFDEFRERECAICERTEDLTPLGHKDYCPQHFREAIADLDMKEQKKQDNSGAWEE